MNSENPRTAIFSKFAGVASPCKHRRYTREQAKILSRQMIELTCRPRANADNERFAQHLCNQQENLFTFLAVNFISSTSKACFGNRPQLFPDTG